MIRKLFLLFSLTILFTFRVISQSDGISKRENITSVANAEDVSSGIKIEAISEELFEQTLRKKSLALDTSDTKKVKKISDFEYKVKLKNGDYVSVTPTIEDMRLFWDYLGLIDNLDVFFAYVSDDDNHYPIRMYSDLTGEFITAMDEVPEISPDKEIMIWISAPESVYITIEIWNKQCINQKTPFSRVLDNYDYTSGYWADNERLFVKCEVFAIPEEDENGNLMWPEEKQYDYFSISLNKN